jgi:hypothetical protein
MTQQPNTPASVEKAAPADPMDWPLPCDVTVGHGTMRKGVKLRTLVTRMKVLYEMATDENADAVAARKPEQGRALLDEFLAAAADAGVTHLSAQQAAQPVAGEPVAFDAEGFRAWVAKNLPDDTIIGSSAWWADHLTAWAQRFAAMAPVGLVPLTREQIEDLFADGLDYEPRAAIVRAIETEFCRINGIGIKAGKDVA